MLLNTIKANNPLPAKDSGFYILLFLALHAGSTSPENHPYDRHSGFFCPSSKGQLHQSREEGAMWNASRSDPLQIDKTRHDTYMVFQPDVGLTLNLCSTIPDLRNCAAVHCSPPHGTRRNCRRIPDHGHCKGILSSYFS